MSDAALMAVTEDELDTLVSIAIRRAEILSEAGSRSAADAWREVMLYERRLAELTGPGEVPGGVARLGAITAAIAANDDESAFHLAFQYCAEAALPSERRSAIVRALQAYVLDRARFRARDGGPYPVAASAQGNREIKEMKHS
jgi:hypothetical protein